MWKVHSVQVSWQFRRHDHHSGRRIQLGISLTSPCLTHVILRVSVENGVWSNVESTQARTWAAPQDEANPKCNSKCIVGLHVLSIDSA